MQRNPARATNATTTMTTTKRARALLAAMALVACAQPPASPAQAQTAPPGSLFAAEPEQQWRLPTQLREISGLAVAPDGRVFTHDDERAVIYEIDAVQGRLVKSFGLDDPIETGDFEGLAITRSGDFYMITSAGILFRFREAANGARAPFETIDTGLGSVCEIEGLAHLQADNSLIVACKRNHDRAMRDEVSLYAFTLSGQSQRATAWLSVPEATLAQAAGVRRFRPSSVDIDPATGRVLLLSASEGAFAELARTGEVLSARALGPGHPQAEGVTVLPDGVLLIADEGGGGQAVLSRYARVP